MDELERYLAQHSAYPLERSGRFTLDPARQGELLASYGLARAELGLLKLAQAAQSSGSPWLNFQSGTSELLVRFQPQGAPARPSWERSSATSPWQTALALGLLSLGQRYELRWSGRGCHGGLAQGEYRENEDDTDRPDFVVHLCPRKSGWWQRLQGGPPSPRALLHERLRWMTIPVHWNGHPLFSDSDRSLSRVAEAQLLSGSASEGGLLLSGQSSARQARYRQGEEILGPSPCARPGWAILGKISASWSETTFVLDGVSCEFERNLLDRPGIRAVLSAQGLKTDLAGLNPVVDGAYRARLSLVRPEVVWLDQIDPSRDG